MIPHHCNRFDTAIDRRELFPEVGLSFSIGDRCRDDLNTRGSQVE
jgi:hypothetical protein